MTDLQSASGFGAASSESARAPTIIDACAVALRHPPSLSKSTKIEARANDPCVDDLPCFSGFHRCTTLDRRVATSGASSWRTPCSMCDYPMKNFLFIGIGALSSLAIFSGCSSSSSGVGVSTSNVGVNDSACSTYAAAVISFNQRCFASTDPTQIASDTARAAQACQDGYSALGVSDLSAQLSACATALESLSCKESPEQDPACGGLFAVGSLGLGSSCTTPLQCASGVCISDTNAAGVPSADCGHCDAAIADGQSCQFYESCVHGDECSGGVCTKRVAGSAGAVCVDDRDCAFPNHCEAQNASDATEALRCVAPKPAGGLCASNNDCLGDLVCGGGGICGAPVAIGARCGFHECPVGSTCDDLDSPSGDSICTPLTFGAPGASCDSQSRLCSQGSCFIPDVSTGIGTCPTIIADGQPCSTGSSPSTSCQNYAQCIDGICTQGQAVCK
jgi:hypothetical protein